MTTCVDESFRSSSSSDRRNCIHCEHMLLPMLDLKPDSRERLRPAVVKDHPNKRMTIRPEISPLTTF